MDELTYHLQLVGKKAKEADELRQTLNDYTDLARKQGEAITGLKDHRDKVLLLIDFD